MAHKSFKSQIAVLEMKGHSVPGVLFNRIMALKMNISDTKKTMNDLYTAIDQ